jgi:hypothetical protein
VSSDHTKEEQISLIRFNNLGVVLCVEIKLLVRKLVAWRMRCRVTMQPSLMSVCKVLEQFVAE